MRKTSFCFYAVLLLLAVAIYGCKHLPHKTTGSDCSILKDKSYIYSIGQAIIENKNNDDIWNLSSVDTSYVYSTTGYFVDTINKDRLILVGAEAGISAGNANNLLILFSCADTPTVLWAGQTGDVSQGMAEIDLDGDGIKELIENTHTMWMGECNDSYSIFNFKGGKRNFLHRSRSTSSINCGMNDLAKVFQKGDTLEHTYRYFPPPYIKHSVILRGIETVKIHNGGKTDEEIIRRLKVSTHTIEIPLTDKKNKWINNKKMIKI